MNAQKRGIQKAIEKANNDNIKRYGLVPFNLQDIPEPCRGVLHKRAGVCSLNGSVMMIIILFFMKPINLMVNI
jgi:hypothetical protein